MRKTKYIDNFVDLLTLNNLGTYNIRTFLQIWFQYVSMQFYMERHYTYINVYIKYANFKNPAGENAKLS